jgi:hypothetical protein
MRAISARRARSSGLVSGGAAGVATVTAAAGDRAGRGGLRQGLLSGAVTGAVGRRRVSGRRGRRATPISGGHHDSGDCCGHDRCKHDFH